MEIKKTLTVFTPTYNRAYCLHLGYEALKRQTSKDFKWLIIDDGSTDNTRQLVDTWIAQGAVEIEYCYKENGGMHTGHNKAYEMIDTELNVCIDSDDWMPDNAVELILSLWRKHGSELHAGLIGLDVSPQNKIIGNEFPKDLTVCKYSELFPKYKVFGDKKIIYRTQIVKRYHPYPTFENEKFVPLYLPIIIDHDLSLLCFNEIFCIVDYQSDGSTLNIYNQYFQNPVGFAHSRLIEMQYLPTFYLKFKSAIHFISSCIISRKTKFFSKSKNKLLILMAIPFGVILYVYLLRKKDKTRNIKKYIHGN